MPYDKELKEFLAKIPKWAEGAVIWPTPNRDGVFSYPLKRSQDGELFFQYSWGEAGSNEAKRLYEALKASGVLEKPEVVIYRNGWIAPVRARVRGGGDVYIIVPYDIGRPSRPLQDLLKAVGAAAPQWAAGLRALDMKGEVVLIPVVKDKKGRLYTKSSWRPIANVALTQEEEAALVDYISKLRRSTGKAGTEVVIMRDGTAVPMEKSYEGDMVVFNTAQGINVSEGEGGMPKRKKTQETPPPAEAKAEEVKAPEPSTEVKQEAPPPAEAKAEEVKVSEPPKQAGGGVKLKSVKLVPKRRGYKMDALTNYGLLVFSVPDSRVGFVLRPIAEAEGALTIAVPAAYKVELPQVKGVRPVGKSAKTVYMYVPLKRSKKRAKKAAAVEAPPPEITSAVFTEEAKRSSGTKRRRKKAVEA
ncbi:MAG: hypothetical protein JHC22_08020 [Thermoproteus sp.]|jgi:hypothetical protein|nr:hypothetical protein [Thermoproteus sp.]